MTLKLGIVDFYGMPFAILNAKKEFGLAFLCFCVAIEWE